jgi:HrpA-like RNA helicase
MYDSFDVCPRAEILCIQPSIAVLKLKYLGVVDDIEKFEWLEAPSPESIRGAIQSLKWLNALDLKTNELTETGRFMAKLGLSPMLSAMILKGIEMSCEDHIIVIAGMLSVAQNIWWRSKDLELRQLADEKRAYFAHDNDRGGDHIQLLKIFLEWESLEKEKRSKWCRDNMINGKAMNIALEFVHETNRQLKKKLTDLKSLTFDQNLVDKLLLCVAAGYFQNLALSNGSLKAGYQLVVTENTNAQVHRSSTIAFGKQPAKYVVYHEILNLNGTNCMTIVCPIQYEWLPKTWLNSLPRQPTDLIFVNHVFENLGPTLMSACLGKRCAKKQQLEDSLGVVLDVNYEQATLTIWCKSDKLNKAKSHLEQLMKIEREKLVKEVEEYDIVGSTRVLLGAGGEPISMLTADEYVKVIVTGLPTNVTEQDIEKKFQTCGAGKDSYLVNFSFRSTNSKYKKNTKTLR